MSKEMTTWLRSIVQPGDTIHWRMLNDAALAAFPAAQGMIVDHRFPYDAPAASWEEDYPLETDEDEVVTRRGPVIRVRLPSSITLVHAR